MSNQKLDPVVKQRILKALRSGRYRFTRGTLFETTNRHSLDADGDLIGQHCTLGVIYKEFGIKNSELVGRGNLTYEQIPKNLRECIGKFFADGGSCPKGRRAMNINDDSDSYEGAAQWIEDNL